MRTELSREPKPIVFGSAASLRPIPGQLSFPAAGERSNFDPSREVGAWTTYANSVENAGNSLDTTDES